jgi:adenine-specific DNA-methyltransferase
MTDTSAKRKARGAFFTPPPITRFLADWAVRTAEDQILEPSCGEAEFLLASGARLRDLGAGLFVEPILHGVELHAPSAEAASARVRDSGLVADIRVSDFFDVPAIPAYDAVVGNPPYVRYQDFAGEARAKGLRAALQDGVRLNGLASSWAAFVVHAARFLRTGGRLGLVLPAELLSVKYAAEVRRFLLRRFGSVKLVMFEDLVFPGVQEEVVLLLAEGEGPAPYFEVHQARDASDLPNVERAEWVAYAPGADDKWMPAVLRPEAVDAYRGILADEGFETLVDWGNTYLGSVTGNNRYFTLDRAAAFQLRIPKNELVPISPPGSRHLRGLTFTDTAWEELANEERSCYLLVPHAKKPSRDALEYIWAGEKVGIHKTYKCRVRSPWWRVPMVPVADLLLTYMDRDRPRLVTNRAGVRHLNSLYGVTLRPERKHIGMDLLPIATLNSVTLLGAELVGRAYGGGILKLEPREADKLPVPSLTLIDRCSERLRALRPQLSVTLRQGKLTEAVKMVDRVLLTEGAGFSHEQLREVRDAREVLFGRRVSRAAGKHGSD